MSDEASAAAGEPSGADAARGAVIVGVVPDLPSRVLKEAARYARLLGAPLLVVHVDVTRFVTYEDPDGYVHSAPDRHQHRGRRGRARDGSSRRRPRSSTDTTSTGASASSSATRRWRSSTSPTRSTRGSSSSARASAASASPSASSSPDRWRRGSRTASTGRSSSCRSVTRCRTTRRSGRPDGFTASTEPVLGLSRAACG